MYTRTIGIQTEDVAMCTTSTQTDEEPVPDVEKVARPWKMMRDVWQEEFLHLPVSSLPEQKRRRIMMKM
jgi:hypothetical protein